MVSGRPALGFGAPTHTRCSPVTLDFPVKGLLPSLHRCCHLQAEQGASYCRHHRASLSRWLHLQESFLSFTHPCGDLLSQRASMMGRKGCMAAESSVWCRKKTLVKLAHSWLPGALLRPPGGLRLFTSHCRDTGHNPNVLLRGENHAYVLLF